MSDQAPPDPVRWGVLGAAKIARDRIIPALAASPWCEAVALASRSADTARETAAAFGIARSYVSYDALLADPEVEAVYIPVPNHLHVALSLAALRAGKHVLCEKPVGLTSAEAAALREKPASLRFSEGFMVRHHPQWPMVRRLIRDGAIGPLRAINLSLTIANDDPDNVRNNPAFGGGAVYDLGCYAVVTGRYFFEGEPARVIMLEDRDPRFGIDRQASAILDYGDGRQQSVTIGMQNGASQRALLIGTRGRIEMMAPYIPDAREAPLVTLSTSLGLDTESVTILPTEAVDQYERQVTHFARAVRGLEPELYGVEDAIAQMRVIDALFASAQSQSWRSV
jgi:predicted dehydrogenase